jgi:hypothetical protein
VQRQAKLVVVAPPALDQFELGTSEAEKGLQLELGEFARQVAQAQVRCLPALHRRGSSCPGMQPKIRRAGPNSNAREINNLLNEGRAIAGKSNRHFLH